MPDDVLRKMPLQKVVSKKDAGKKEAARKESAALSAQSEQQPPLIKRAEVVAFALVGLLIIAIGAVLHFGRPLFLPIVTAFALGTMLAPGARALERRNVPRSLAAVLVVTGALLLVGLVVGLITAPLIEWSARLPELRGLIEEKMHIFDRPLAILRQIQTALGMETETGFQLPKIEWVQPTLGFLSPTLAEFILFFATLVLFVASWPDLRKTLVMNFAEHEGRLRTLRILNEIEGSLGQYLLTVTLINIGVGIATGLICAATGIPNAAGLGALAATVNYIPLIGPVLMFVVLCAVSVLSASTFGGALLAPLLFAGMTFLEGHFLTPMIIGRRLQLNALAVFVTFAFWTWLWGPMGAFLSSPILIVAMILKQHLTPSTDPQLPVD